VDPLDALREECEQVSKVALGLSEEDFSRPIRCSAWNVKELLDLEWDVVDFIEAGAGRRPLTEDERDILGPLAERFPLLG